MSQHEVGQHTGGAPGHPHLTVHQDLAPCLQGVVYKVHHLIEINCNIGLRYVYELDSFVSDTPRLVIFLGRNTLTSIIL